MATNIPLPSFVWGRGGARLTPEELARQRQYEAQILARGVDTSPAASNFEGLARVANALAGSFRRGRLERAEEQNRAEDAALAAPLVDAYTGSFSTPSTVPMTSAAGEVSATSPAIPAATIPQSADADTIRSGLIQRGLSPQVADAFLVNFQDESGLNAGINEANPAVPGSRGGYGLYQLTGPRRTAYESFANQRGVSPADTNTQLDFLAGELGLPNTGLENQPFFGSESKAAQSILGARNTPEAAQAIVNNFLRPSPEYRASRSAAYAGLPSVQTAPVVPVEVASLSAPQTATDAIAAQSPQTGYVDPMVTTAYQAPPPPMTAARNQPQAAPQLPAPTTIANAPAVAAVPQEMAQAQAPQMPQAPQLPSVPPQVLAQAIEAAQSPYASERTKSVADALIKRQQDFQQAQQQQQQFLFEQQYRAAQEAQDPLRQAQIRKAQLDIAQAENPPLPESVRALQQRAQLSGLQPGTPEYNSFIQTGGVRTPPTISPPPTGYRYIYDANQNPVSLEVIPGSPQALAEQQAVTKQEKAQEAKDISSDLVIGSTNKALDAMENAILPTTGTLGKIASFAPESAAADVVRQIEPLKATASFETLTQMRQASPTGGALGAVSDSEQKLLQAKAGALDPFSPNFKRDLLDYERSVLRIVHGKDAGDKIFDEAQKARAERANQVQTDIPGVTIRRKN